MNAVYAIQKAEHDLDTDLISLREYQERIRKFMDVEPVVRCKDCIYWTNRDAREKLTYWTPCKDMKRNGNWFCADGKKKEKNSEKPKNRG